MSEQQYPYGEILQRCDTSAFITALALVSSKAAPSPFSLSNPAAQYAWDSTTITIAKECPRRYQYKVLQQLESKAPSSAIALAFGILVHEGIETFHRYRAHKMNYDSAVMAALKLVIQSPLYARLPTEDEFQDEKAEAAQDAEDDGISVRNSRVRTRYYLWRALVWYFEHYRSDPMEVVCLGDGTPAVELSFRIPTGFSLASGEEVLLCGHLDKVVRFNEQLYVSDIKTTKSITHEWRREFDLSHQMTGYTLGGKVALEQSVAGVVIDGICLQVGATKFARHFTHRTDSQLGEYLTELRLLTEEYEHYAQAQHWPMRQSFCRFCEFKPVCSQPPEMRGAYLRQYFRPAAKPWNPLEAR